MKLETAILTGRNGHKQTVSTRINDQGQPEITGRSGKFRLVTRETINHTRPGKRKDMQQRAFDIAQTL